MKFLNLFNRKKRKTVLIVQCRLSSTRLPRKALLPLGGKCVIDWVLDAMKEVPADEYYLATDFDSEKELAAVAERHGWKLFAGSTQDVLDRFCRIIEQSKADVVVRATADNPFLFYEAAAALEEEFSVRDEASPVDYITFSDLPHGSGVEMFNAHSLLKAASETSDPYDHEHVGPALYNHRESYNCLFIKAPNRWNYSELRTTIDTPADYRRALALVHAVSGEKAVTKAYTTEEILNGMWNNFVRNPVLLVPCVKKGKGTGHLRRCLDIARTTGQDIYIPQDAGLEQCENLLQEAVKEGLNQYQIVRDINAASCYKLIITDLFHADDQIVQKLTACPEVAIAALDEGRLDTSYVDYLLDIIPSVGLSREANRTESAFIPLPQNRRNESAKEAALHTAIVVLGGEDPAGLTVPATVALARTGMYVTAVASSQENAILMQENLNADISKFVKVIPPVENLREKLASYDLVVTHYGFTAFEAANAGCAVLLLGTTALHEDLAKTYGFTCIPAASVNESTVKQAVSNPQSLFRPVEQKSLSLTDFVVRLSQGRRISCPVCRTFSSHRDPVVARTPERTFRRCQNCGMIYMAWTLQSEETQYNHAYFFEDYEKQYGKTYLDDFASIKAQGVRRVGLIDYVYRRMHSPVTPTVLDIGCAMGPFMDAANDSGWQVFGIDVSKDAVEYVQTSLKYPAVCSSFPQFDPGREFGIQQFDAVTMWYVIEHFEDLDSVLKAVSRLVKKGGVFAFSTPSASGVSGKYNTRSFFTQSPADHYTLWEPARAQSILKRYGFSVVKTVSTGIHPERFPSAKKHGWKKNSLQYNMLGAASHLFNLGDTFEVYCRKTADLD